jgi:CP family cyanate transporter-like MFS transporter
MTARRARSPWVPVAGAALAVGLGYLVIFSVPPLITTFVDDLGLTHAQAGALMSVTLGGFLVSSLLSGKVAGRFGAVPVVAFALVLSGAASICFGLTESLAVFLVCRAAIGVAGGLIYAPALTFVTSLVPAARANLGVGVFLCGLSIGGTIAFFATGLLEEALDWRWPAWLYGAASLAGAALAVALMAGAVARRKAPSQGSGYRAVAASPAMRVLCLTLFAALFVAYGVFTWIPPYLDESAGFTTGQISLAASLMTLSGIPATFGAGLLADRTGRPLLVAGAGLMLPLSLVVFALAESPPYAAATLVAAVSALGVSGGLAPLYALPPVLVPEPAASSASGVAAAAAMGGAVTSTYLGGWIVGDGDGYGAAFWMYTVAAAVTAFALVPLVGAGLGRARSFSQRAEAPGPVPETGRARSTGTG